MPDILQNKDAFKDIITCNTEMLSIFQYIETAAQTCKPVLITGEPGVGKKLLAKSIHAASKRQGQWVVVNIAGLEDEMFSQLFFGSTQANSTDKNNAYHEGVLNLAEGGTLLLNEIGGLSPVSQMKLLKLLQKEDQEGYINYNVHFIAATNVDLWELQRQGRFHNDLNAILRPHHIHIPPLRERLEDLPNLVNHFLDEAALAFNKKRPTPPKELLTLLNTYSFPENIRELRSMVFDAVLRHKSKVLSLDVFKSYIDREHKDFYMPPKLDADDASPFKFFSELPTIKQLTHLLVEEAMRRSNGNQSIAARMLGISQPALSKRLKNASQNSKN